MTRVLFLKNIRDLNVPTWTFSLVLRCELQNVRIVNELILENRSFGQKIATESNRGRNGQGKNDQGRFGQIILRVEKMAK